MSFRYMRLMIMFDLPSVMSSDRKSYVKFMKFLRSEGFVIMQESIYTKLLLNNTAATLMQDKIRKNSPKKGLVQMLIITEKQFSNIQNISGEVNSDVVQSVNRLIFL